VWQHWKTLRLKAHAAPLFSGHVEMRVSGVAGGIRLETETQAKFLGATVARAESVSVLDRATGLPSEHVGISKRRGRRYRFDDAGYSVEKLEPPDGRDAPLDTWSVVWRKEHARPRSADGGASLPVYDYYGMLLNLRRLDLARPGDEARVFVATTDGPAAYVIRVVEERRMRREYALLPSGEKRTEELRELRLQIAPADPDSEEGFLGMAGETELWVEAESKTLLEIRGKIPGIPGQVELRVAALG
jgi:hypothetical protein